VIRQYLDKKRVNKKKIKKKVNPPKKMMARNQKDHMALAWSQFVTQVNESNSRKHKIETVKKYPQLRQLWKLVFTESTGINTTSLQRYRRKIMSKGDAKRRKVIHSNTDLGLYDLMQSLCNRTLTGDAAHQAVLRLLRTHPQEAKDIEDLIVGKPRIGINIQQINSALVEAGYEPACNVTTVALAHPFNDKRMRSLEESDQDTFVMRKFDGVRAIMQLGDNKKNNTQIFTRNFKRIKALQSFCDQIRVPERFQGYYVDGELCVVDPSTGQEDFSKAVSRFRKHDTTEHFKYIVFDFIDPDSMRAARAVGPFADTTWSSRIEMLRELLDELKDNRLEILHYEKLDGEGQVFNKWQLECEKKKWEGLILRLDAPYVGKRTHHLLKVKQFHTDEFVVKDITVTKRPIYDSKTGTKTMTNVLCAAVIKVDGCFVCVGSGFTEAQRIRYFQHPEELIGKTIEVQYFEKIYSSDGSVSLRFPTMKYIWGDNRDM
jgi:DNA ligase-1